MRVLLFCILMWSCVPGIAKVYTEYYYPMGEYGTRTGARPIDASGNRHHIQEISGALPSTATNVPAGLASTNSLHLSGVGAAYALQASGYSPPVANAGFEGWVRCVDQTHTNHLFGIGSSSQGFYVKYVASNGITAFVSGVALTNAYRPTTSEWVHVAVVRAGTTITYYVNGASRAVTTTNTPTAVDNWMHQIGDNVISGDEYVDEFRVFTFGTGEFNTTNLLYNASAPVWASQPVCSGIHERTNVAVTAGEVMTLSPSAWGTTPMVYHWYGNGTYRGATTNRAFAITNVTTAGSGQWYAVASNSVGSATSTVLQVSVRNLRTLLPYRNRAQSPTVAQSGVAARQYGMFIHYSIDTFADTTGGTTRPSAALYQPNSSLNPDQWVATAAAGGMKYIVITAKHQAGFCLWPTATTSYCVTNSGSGNTLDIIGALAESCRARGLKLGLYYSLWDEQEPNYKSNFYPGYFQVMTNQLGELLSNYGAICELWLDGAWERARDPQDWHMPEIYDFVSRLQPACAVIMNGGIGHYQSRGYGDYIESALPSTFVAGDPMLEFPFDIRAADPQYANTPDPKLYSWRNQPGANYYLPYETPQTIMQNGNYWYVWFWRGDSTVVTAAQAAGVYTDGTTQTNAALLNVPPSTNGIMEANQSNVVWSARVLLGLPVTTP